MSSPLSARLTRAAARFVVVARPAAERARLWLLALLRGPVRLVLQTVAALLVLFLEWGWEPLANAMSALAGYLGFHRLTAWIVGLPPYGALALFAAPAIGLIPIKVFAVYLFASGHPIAGVMLIVAAKLAGTAVVARIYILTKPQLMQIAWFAPLHDRFMGWKDQMYAQIKGTEVWRQGRLLRVELKRAINRAWIALKPQRAWLSAQVRGVRAWFEAKGRLSL